MKKILLNTMIVFGIYTSNAIASDIKIRYFMKEYTCAPSSSTYEECLATKKAGEIWFFYAIGIAIRGNKICGIADYSANKVDVTRFVGNIVGNKANITYSSSWNFGARGKADITISNNKLYWKTTKEFDIGSHRGYHSGKFELPELTKSIPKNNSYIFSVKEICQDFLIDNIPFDELAWGF